MEEALIRNAVKKVRKETNSNKYSISAFNELFDERLKKLILYYNFDF